MVIVQRQAGASSSAGCSGTFATDTFTEAAATEILLTAHTKDSGGGWTERADTVKDGYSVYLNGTNDVILSTTVVGGGALAAISDTLTCFDYSVEMTAQVGVAAGNHRIGLLMRYDPVTDTGYNFRIEGDGDADLYIRTGGGAGSKLADGTVASFNASTVYDLRCDVEGSQITCYVDDVEVVSATDGTYTTGNPGVFITNTGPRGFDFSAAYLP